MSIFKSSSASSKNQSASATATPAQTPRSSMQASRPKNGQSTMTVDQALEQAMKKSPYSSTSGTAYL
ncbi:hypothetical protein BGX28_008573 [Mortierella sp. GBA30]|nr:hypothetical protein BGX28_008573 [Mortierella sp. GBA30]